jgi:hypothetical protein
MSDPKSSAKAQPKWKEFEEVVFQLQQSFSQDAEVKLDDSIEGLDSKQKRQIDISVRRNVGQYSMLIAMECKNYKRPVDVKDVDAFASVVQDVRANKGAIISSKGFTKAAIELAKTRNIDTFRLVDTESVDWKAYASIPMLLESTNYRGVRFRYSRFAILPSAIQHVDPRLLRVYTKDGSDQGTMWDIVAGKWNGDQIPLTTGDHEVVVGEDVLLEIDGAKYPVTIHAVVLVEKKFYAGNIAVDVKGFHDVQKGGIITRQFTTEKIYPANIEAEVRNGTSKTWHEVESPATTFLIGLAIKSALPNSEEFLALADQSAS